MLKWISFKLRALLKKSQVERDLSDELGYHVENAIQQNIARGMTPEEARRAARIAFGGVEQIKEASRDARGTRLIEDFLQDLRYGARVLRKSPGFVLTVVVMLGLGVGANTAIFSVVDKVLLRSLPVKQPDRLVKIAAESVNPKFLSTLFSYPDYKDYREQNKVFDGIVAHGERTAVLGQGDGSRRVQISFVSSNYFDLLGVSVRGRTFFSTEETAEGAEPVAVLSYALWASLGADPGIIGKSIILNGTSLTVVGVAARDFTGIALESPVDIWAPLAAFPTLFPEEMPIQQRRSAWLELMGRMKPRVDLAQAQAGLETVAQSVFQANTPVADRNLPFNEKHIILTPGGRGSSVLRSQLGPALKLMSAVVALLLLIACANVAGLLMARAATQRRELAIRLALGAGRGRLVRMSLVQCALLAALGAGAGLAIAPWLHSILLGFEPGLDLSGTAIDRSLDIRVLGFTVVISSVCGVLFGLFPSLSSSRPDIVSAIKQAGQTMSEGRRRVSARSLLVVTQVGLATVMLVGSALLVRSLRNLLSIDPGFRPENVMVVPIDLKSGIKDEVRAQFFRSLTERLQGLPGVSSVSTAGMVPLTGSVGMVFISIEGRQQTPGVNLAVDYNYAGPGYHRLMGTPILKGRGFTNDDRMGAPQVVVVNETFARTFYPGENPLGRRISLGTTRNWLEIVGVAGDVKTSNLTEPPKPHIDMPALQRGYGQFSSVLVRFAGDESAVTSAVRSAVRDLDPNATTETAQSMSDIVADSIAPAQMASTLTSLFGLIALLLAAIGLYGIMSYSVNQRSREIGIRMALGANSTRVLILTLVRGATLFTIGIGLGLAGAVAVTRLLRSILYGVGPGDIASFAAAAVLLGIVGLLSCYLPARRAAKGDPMAALRCE